MNPVKIGKFIAQMRKKQGYTQRQLADTLCISDKTVSKWETGNGLPEVSLMLPLCDALEINVNELLSGEKLTDSDYKKKAEENMMDLVREKEESRKKIILSVVVGVITIVAGTALVLVSGMFPMNPWARVLFIVLGMVVIAGGIGVAAVLDMEAGTFECRHCGARFQPDAKAYIAAPHTLRTRYLKCPKCGKSSYCKKRLTH